MPKNSPRETERRLERLVGQALRQLHIRNAHAAIFLLEGRKLTQLKRKYTGKKAKKAVDVLAFPEPAGFPHPETRKRFLGEIYINAELAARDPDRARYLLLHGLLHLLGYTHKGKSDTLRMQRREAELIKNF